MTHDLPYEALNTQIAATLLQNETSNWGDKKLGPEPQLCFLAARFSLRAWSVIWILCAVAIAASNPG